MKILSPAGNIECLKTAVYNGADEVYLGINEYNARNNIDGFTLATLKEGVDFAHVHGVKVLLAINILFSDKEIQNALDTIVDAYNIGVDAFILQDLGLARLVHENYPEIELHASTQMGLHNLEGVQEVIKYGFKRVVLARETPLDEIKRIKENCDVEIEYFAQGALCVSFSGNCYLSSYMHNASGNRGRCKQLCRLPYTLEKDGKKIKTGFLLSAKDFNMIDRLDDLKKAGVDIIKIEGRARRASYVGLTTREYYNAIHKNKVDEDNLRLAFNREYTAGYFDGNGKIISPYNNHIGIKVGKVEKVNKGKNFNEVFISCNRPISSKSTFKTFAGIKEKTTITAYDLKEISKGKYRITTTQNIDMGDDVHLILDYDIENTVLQNIKKRDLDIRIFAKENYPIKAVISLGKEKLEVFGDTCEKAIKQPITYDDLSVNFSKSDIFSPHIQVAVLDDIFMPKQKLNDFRRKVFESVHESIVNSCRHHLEKIKIKTDYKINKFSDFQIIEDQSEKLIAKNIVYSPEIYTLNEILDFKNKCEKMGKSFFLDTTNFALQSDIHYLRDIIEKNNISIVANNYYALSFNTKIIVGAGLNVYNTHTASTLDLPILTAESTLSSRIKFPYMTLRHCPMKTHLNGDCAHCPYTKGYTYKMENGKTMKLKRKKITTCTFYLTD